MVASKPFPANAMALELLMQGQLVRVGSWHSMQQRDSAVIVGPQAVDDGPIAPIEVRGDTDLNLSAINLNRVDL